MVRMETFGCAVAQAESEMISGLLREAGLEGADVVIVNTCTVKTPTENKIVRLLRQLQAEGKKVVVAGCLPPARKKITEEFPKFSFIGINTHDVVEAVSAAAKGGRYVNVVDSKEKVCLPRVRANPQVGILPIAEGCLGSCNYCQVKNVRGELRSYSMGGLLEEVSRMVAGGVKEIWVTAQDTGAWGKDMGTSLPRLLKEIASLEGDFIIRVGMMNPNHAKSMLDELVEAYGNPKIYKFLHLPVQSGDKKVLEDMNRKYSVADFKKIVSSSRKKFNATISTDVIVGYPTESEHAFNNTLKLIEEVEPDVLNISRYWSRPGTKASELKQLPGSETNRRSRITAELFKKVGLKRNKKWVGWEGDCLISEKNKDGTYTARNLWYKPIVVKSKKDIMGKAVKVKVTDYTFFDLRGNVV